MTLSLYLQCVAMYIFGQVLHVLLVKVPAARQRSIIANETFTFGKYWKSDWHLIVANQVFGAMLIIGLDQIANWKPFILEYLKWFFAGLGYVGSSAILAKFSKYEKTLQNVIDIKTNIADSK